MTPVERFQVLVAKQPDNELYRFSLGQAQFNAGDLAAAEAELRTCCDKRADWMVPRILLGRTLIELERRDEARAVLTEALDLATAQEHEDPESEVRALLAEL